MNDQFTVERVALHLVDRKAPGPHFAQNEIDLAAFTRPEDIEALESFFSGHLEQVWKAQEGSRTRAARFRPNAEIGAHYEALRRDDADFFRRTCDMAQRLHDVSRGLRTSPGLLMVLWFRRANDQRPFLGLFKMDPSRSDKIILRQDIAGDLLLDLAVRHIEQALPDPGDRVLKWAVIPHPTRPAFDVKVKDQEGGADLAQYFVTFLACEPRLSEKQQAQVLLETLPDYAKAHHPDEDWQTGVQDVIEALEAEPVITPQVIVDTVQQVRAFSHFAADLFRQQLEAAQAEDLYVSSATLRSARLRYQLPSGIMIQGPRAEMESLVRIMPLDGGVEFRIRTPSYQKTYE